MVLSYIAPQAVVCKPLVYDAISAQHSISQKSEGVFLLLPHKLSIVGRLEYT